MKQTQNRGNIELQLSVTKQNSPNRSKSNNKNRSPLLQHTSVFLNKKIVSPQKLKILVLSGNELQNAELQFLSKCVNLIKLDLSHNNITRLNEKQAIHQIKNLRVLNLQSNKLLSVQSIAILFGIQSLQVFSYKQNPIQQDPRSQHEIINNLVNLKVINYRVIFVEQRHSSLIVVRKPQFITKQFEQWQPAQHSERYYLRVLKLHLEYIDNMWMFANPIVKIQRIWRAVLEERQEEAKHNAPLEKQLDGKQLIMARNQNQQQRQDQPISVIKVYQSQSAKKPQLQITKTSLLLFQYFTQWKQYSSNKKAVKQELQQERYRNEKTKQGDINFIQVQNKLYLTQKLEDYYITKRNLKIKHQYQRYLKKIRQRIHIRKMAEIFRRCFYKKVTLFSQPKTSFYSISGISSTKKIYFNRVQQHLIENFLAHIFKNYKFNEQNYKFGIANQYVAIRLLDPDTYASKQHNNPLTYLMWPCMRSVILKKKKFPYKNKSSIIKIKSLSYIKNLNKTLTLEQRKKSNKTYQRIDKFIQNEYHQGLGFLYCENEEILKQLIRMIYYHNIKAKTYPKIIERSQMMSLLESYQQNVLIYSQKLLERTTSAVKIQQQWRRYINNKRQTETIYQKLKRNRAARLIQRFIRNRVFYHRLYLMRNLEQELKLYDGNDIIVHESVYKNLQNIIDSMQGYIELYPGLKLDIVDKKIKLYHNKFNSKQIFFPTLRSNHFQSRSFVSSSVPLKKVDVYKMLHMDSQVKIIECNGQRFYQFIFKSVNEAKLRIACFAVLTYRMYKKSYLMLLSKSTLQTYNNQIKCYEKHGVQCEPFQSVSSLNKLKLNLLNDITKHSSCPFVYLNQNYTNLFDKNQLAIKKTVNIQFYQKRFQDFPQKYASVLNVITQNQQEIIEKIIEEKFNNLQKMLIKQSDINGSDQKSLGKQKNDKIRSISEMDKFRKTKLNVVTPPVQMTNNKMNLNFSDLQLQNEIISQLQHTNKKLNLKKKNTSFQQAYKFQDPNENNQTKYNATFVQKIQQSKKDKVTKYLEAEKEKRLFVKQQKETDLNKIRQKRKLQKLMNKTLKSFHQNQRVEMLKKKAQQIKQYKRRSLSNSKKDGDESQFIQQGNFIMQQNLRMNLMRQKLKQAQRLNDKRKSLPKSLGNTQFLRRQSDDTKSVRSNHSLKQKRLFFEGKDTQIAQVDDKLNQTAKFQAYSLQQTNFRNTEQVRKRSYTKKRTKKVGAYLRDPSLVHGVFPQQYFPIQNSKGGITFPRVG